MGDDKVKKNLIINAIILLFAIFIMFAIAEIIMRFSWEMGGWVKRPIYQRSFNPYLRYELKPNSRHGTNISINSDGFRGKEYTIIKPKNTFRIIMLGDSETLSVNLSGQDTLAMQLEELLNKRSASVRYEVLNFGVEGYNTFQELEMLEVKGLKYEPDLIILNYVLNDPEPAEHYFTKSFLMRHSALARYFSSRIRKARIKRERNRLKIKTEVDHYYYLHRPEYFSRVKMAILEMAQIIRKGGGGRLVVVIFPTSSIEVKDFKDNYPYRTLHNMIKNISSQKVISIDLIDEFNRLNLTPQTASLNYKYNESHKNPRALKASAEYIYVRLKVERLLPQ